MPDILITDEACQYLEMLSPGITEDFDYRGNHLWLVDLDIHALTVIAQNSLVGETLSDTIIPGARLDLTAAGEARHDRPDAPQCDGRGPCPDCRAIEGFAKADQVDVLGFGVGTKSCGEFRARAI
jgi:hypothetical protein